MKHAFRLLTVLAACAAAGPVAAAALEFPSTAIQTASSSETFGSQRVPITGYENGQMQSVWAEGAIQQQAWQMALGGQTTLQILAPLRDQLSEAGYEIIFECAANDCGGFDFRYALDLLPEPDMHVDLGDYRFIAAQRATDTRPEYITVVVSRTDAHGFVHVTQVGEDALPVQNTIVTATKSPPAIAELVDPEKLAGTVVPQALPDLLAAEGRAVLEDLSFQTGSSRLEDAEFASLNSLAEYLNAGTERQVVLVGHTDAEGTLDNNIRLSKARANAVRTYLVETLGVARNQVVAEGVGYLVPLTTNQTEEGRTANRRVEVIVTSME